MPNYFALSAEHEVCLELYRLVSRWSIISKRLTEMRDYISNLLPKIKDFSARLDNLALLTDQPWVQLDESEDRTVFVFRKDGNELLVSKNGDVNTCGWEYLEHMNSLVIEVSGQKILYNQGFLDESVMILRKDGGGEYLLMANENKVDAIKTDKVLEYLSRKYVEGSKEKETKKINTSNQSTEDNIYGKKQTRGSLSNNVGDKSTESTTRAEDITFLTSISVIIILFLLFFGLVLLS